MTSKKNSSFIDELNAELGEDASSPEEAKKSPDDFSKMLAQSFSKPSKKLSVGDKIRGKILVLGREDVFVTTGTQTDGSVKRVEILDADGSCPYKEGDFIELFVTLVKRDEIRLSKKASGKHLAADLEDAFDQMLAIPGRVVEVCKGGVRVNIKGVIAFCPISQLDTKHVEDGSEYVGKSLEFRITQFSEGGKNVVVSRKKLLLEEQEVGSASFLDEHQDGAIVPGRVSRLEKFGAFVELVPGVDGLVHISEIAWSRIGDPSEILQPGQEVNVKILRRELVNGRMKIALSIKQALPKETVVPGAATPVSANDPWSKLTVGQVVTGKVNRKEPYGLFIELEPGITGLLHQSKTTEQSDFKYEKIRVKDSITVRIDEIKREERRISLGLPRDAGEDDWREHQQVAGSFGSLGDQLKNAFSKKK